ncbi:MAG: DNA methyltransferase [Candidatus Thorarchaeota archaeon]
MPTKFIPRDSEEFEALLVDRPSRIIIQGSMTEIMSLIEKSGTKHPRLIFYDFSNWYNRVNIQIRPQFEGLISVEQLSSKINMIPPTDNDFWVEKASFLTTCLGVLAEDGFLAVKVNGSIKAPTKVLLDKIFGYGHLVNEIIIDSPFMVTYAQDLRNFERTDYILLYSKGTNPRVNPIWNEKTSGGYWHSFVSKGQGKPKTFIFQNKKVVLSPPLGTHWKLKQDQILKLCRKGKIRLNSKGNPEYWVPEKKGQIVDTNWLDISSVEEKLALSQKLSKRLLSLLLKEKDLFFNCTPEEGSSFIVAEELSLDWMGIEENPQNVQSLVERIMTKMPSSPINIVIDSRYPLSEVGPFRHPVTGVELDFLPNFLPIAGTIPKQKKKDEIFLLSETFDRIDTDWRNLLYHGDCGAVLDHLSNEILREKIKLIYIDPPFFTGIHENIVIPLGQGNSQFETLAYHNALEEENPIQAFVSWFSRRIRLMFDLLRQDGILFVRLDYHIGHYARLILDRIFGSGAFIGEFLIRRMKKNLSKKQAWGQKHLINHSDFLLVYRKSAKGTIKLHSVNKRRRRGQDYAEREYSNDNIWLDIAGYQKAKKTLYPTENSESLLNRVLKAASQKDDIIADFFCGSGTSMAVAEKLGRRWIGADLSSHSIQQVRRRMLGIPNLKPFQLYLSSDINPEKTLNTQKNGSHEVRIVTFLRKGVLKLQLADFKPKNTGNIIQGQKYHDLIDSWAIDWDYKRGIFHLDWVSYRSLRGRRVIAPIASVATHRYSHQKSYMIKVKIVDIFARSYSLTREIKVGGS